MFTYPLVTEIPNSGGKFYIMFTTYVEYIKETEDINAYDMRLIIPKDQFSTEKFRNGEQILESSDMGQSTKQVFRYIPELGIYKCTTELTPRLVGKIPQSAVNCALLLLAKDDPFIDAVVSEIEKWFMGTGRYKNRILVQSG